MAQQRKQIALNVFFRAFGHHPGAWRHTDSPNSGQPDLAYWIKLAQLAEQAKFDAVFVADFVGQSANQLDQLAYQPLGYQFEPLTLMTAIAGATERIGLISTLSTNFNEPYNVARRFASIDHISGGRAGWNVVSSLSESSARVFGVDNPPDHATRYQRAGEFVELTKKFWDSWDDGAFGQPDKAAGEFLDIRAAHPVHHRGKFFTAEGLIDIARPVQGYPVIVQAGNSDTGKDFAAEIAEMVYCSAQQLDIGQAYYADVKSRMAKYGRDPSQLLITPGLSPVIGSSEQEAQDKFGELQDLYDFRNGVKLMGFDLSDYPLDGPLPDLPEVENGKGRRQQLIDLARRENLTIRQLVLRFSVVRGHNLVVGTAAQVADAMEEWFTGEAADGFNVIPPLLPSGFEDFAREVVPELQRRGLFRTEYEGRTLRDHLGLDRPANANLGAEARRSVA
jgi:FMN-dependent oxidoreductase (nitrilotriacetate monooxygenase family)